MQLKGSNVKENYCGVSMALETVANTILINTAPNQTTSPCPTVYISGDNQLFIHVKGEKPSKLHRRD